MAVQEREVLITVKAYPTPSRRYGETVCCAGIDVKTREWIRLYPIPFRDLDESKKFAKYTVLRVRCEKAKRDQRAESYKVDTDSIEIVRVLDTRKNGWRDREKIVVPTVLADSCAITACLREGRSLATVKPSRVSFSWEKAPLEKQAQREACYAQLSFFDRVKKSIEQIPFRFYYFFTCAQAADCTGHKLPIVDWELGQSYRSWRHSYRDEATLLQKIRERWLVRMCSPDGNVFFYLGNMQRFQHQFMVLGVFYPPK
ncbi:MAG TPA: hypothetical protein ENN81_08805 [Phycisphaerales bacterium]|nr:hypothetical protein [Phycisphaerales bacterium]